MHNMGHVSMSNLLWSSLWVADGDQCHYTQLLNSGKFLNGANFHIFRTKPQNTKIKTAKIYSLKYRTGDPNTWKQ